MMPSTRRHIVFIVHYFAPINSSGAKRVDALSKYFAQDGHDVTVITTRKTGAQGTFTEPYPAGVKVIELDSLGRLRPSQYGAGDLEPMYTARPSLMRRIKGIAMSWFGQVPDPRLPFALNFLAPWLDGEARAALKRADVIIGSSPPWSMLLAAYLASRRFGKPMLLDYRDHFSECHEMPGSWFSDRLEKVLDRFLSRRAKRLVTISEPMRSYYAGFNPDTHVVLNGYDPEPMERALQASPWEPGLPGRAIVSRHMGIVSPGRIPRSMLVALQQLHQKGYFAGKPEVRFEFYGYADLLSRTLAESYPELLPMFHFYKPVSYQESLGLICAADHVLFSEVSNATTLSGQGILTTKLFEYVGAGRTIIANISPTTLAGQLVRNAGKDHVVTDQVEDFVEYFQSDVFWSPRESRFSEFGATLSRKHQAGNYFKIIDEMLG
ncbi:TPR/glycosyl transferase domain protein [plant metagenome]|uniref:TPR/glycosyl transferase domain protein n=1 Tax=plant metagenome TaxID=1297885 RepID=A0A484R2M7_9ZZZZ